MIARYGLAAVFVGAGIEGEVAAITGGILAHDHLLPVWGVVISAATGACFADQLWFWMARQFRHAKWVERTKRRRLFQRAVSLLEHHLILFTLSFRFVYGMRTVTPIAISASRIRSRTFVMLNMISAAVWGLCAVWIGYAFGEALQPWMSSLKLAPIAIGGIILIAVLISLAPRAIRRLRRSRPAA